MMGKRWTKWVNQGNVTQLQKLGNSCCIAIKLVTLLFFQHCFLRPCIITDWSINQLLMTWTIKMFTGNRKLGLDAGEAALETATTPKGGSRRANYSLPTPLHWWGSDDEYWCWMLHCVQQSAWASTKVRCKHQLEPGGWLRSSHPLKKA